MPTMPRMSNKARKIAYKILGVPPALAFKRNEEEQRINQRLLFEETVRVR